MPVTTSSLRKTPYVVGNMFSSNSVAGILPLPPAPVVGALPAGPTTYRHEHTIYPTLSGRLNHTVVPATSADKRAVIRGPALAAAGDTIFLKYYDNHITSILLPLPVAGGPTFFVTDNLTGCRFFVDRIAAGGSGLIVYHANTHGHSAGPLADCDVQTANASAELVLMHQNAQADYAALGFTLNNVATCTKHNYYLEAGHAERRKRLQGRTEGNVFNNPAVGAAFAGGTTVVGFPVGPTWQFWYQTYGTVDYKRPDIAIANALKAGQFNYLIKKARFGLDHDATFDKFEVIDCQQIW